MIRKATLYWESNLKECKGSLITADDFTAITIDAEINCLISKVLNIPIIPEAHLKS